jgi:hypothetical protein
MAKEEVFPEGVVTGRIWGVWGKNLLPIMWETVKVSREDAYKIRRVYRRLAKMRGRGRLHRLTVFIRHENVVRLLAQRDALISQAFVFDDPPNRSLKECGYEHFVADARNKLPLIGAGGA